MKRTIYDIDTNIPTFINISFKSTKNKLTRCLPYLLKTEKSDPIGYDLMFQRSHAKNRRLHMVSTNPMQIKQEVRVAIAENFSFM